MALITCAECGGKVSDHAKACPHCGCVVVIPANAQAPSQPGHLQTRPRDLPAPPDNDGLSTKQYVLFTAAFLIIPFACVLVSSALYYAWRANTPKKAKQINRLGFIVLGINILVVVLCSFSSAPAQVASSPDGDVEITLPPEWEKVQNVPDFRDAKIAISDPGKGLSLVVFSESRQDIVGMTLDQYAAKLRELLQQAMPSSTATPPRQLTVDGHPAVQSEIRGAINNLNVVFLHTVVETPQAYYQVRVWTKSSQYGQSADTLQNLIQAVRLRGGSIVRR